MGRLNQFADRLSEPDPEPRESFADLIGSLFRQVADLVRDEVALSKAELRDRIRVYRSAVGIVAFGIALGMLASMALVAAAIVGLSPYIGTALAAVIVGALFGVVSIFFVLRGIKELRRIQ